MVRQWGSDRFENFPISEDDIIKKYVENNGDCPEEDNFFPMTAFTSEQIVAILEGNKLSVEIEGKSVELDSEKVLVDRFEKDDLKVLNEGTLTVGLDSKVTDDLKKEGYVRDLIRGIQNQRKESGLNVTDRIKLTVAGDEKLKSAYLMFVDFICNETLTSEINWADSLPNAVKVDADDKEWGIVIEKA